MKMHHATTMWERTLEIREAEAARVFDINALGNLIKEAVGRGLSHVVVKQTMRVDLSITDAALRATKRFQSLGYAVGWISVSRDGQRRVPEDDALYLEMEIDWSGKQVAGIAPVMRSRDLEGRVQAPEASE